MSDFSALIASVESYIRQNGNNEITGNILQQVLVSIINTLGTVSINALETGLSTEQTTRANADAALSGRIDTEEGARQQADNALQMAIYSINTKLEEGAVYKGIATPSTTPPAVTGKVFYVAVQGGTYTDFGNLAVTQGLNIIYNSGSSWYVSQAIGIEEFLTDSENLVMSSGIYHRNRINEAKIAAIIGGFYIDFDHVLNISSQSIRTYVKHDLWDTLWIPILQGSTQISVSGAVDSYYFRYFSSFETLDNTTYISMNTTGIVPEGAVLAIRSLKKENYPNGYGNIVVKQDNPYIQNSDARRNGLNVLKGGFIDYNHKSSWADSTFNGYQADDTYDCVWCPLDSDDYLIGTNGALSSSISYFSCISPSAGTFISGNTNGEIPANAKLAICNFVKADNPQGLGNMEIVKVKRAKNDDYYLLENHTVSISIPSYAYLVQDTRYDLIVIPIGGEPIGTIDVKINGAAPAYNYRYFDDYDISVAHYIVSNKTGIVPTNAKLVTLAILKSSYPDGYQISFSREFRYFKRKTIRLLSIGNSASDDALSYVPFIMQNMGLDVDFQIGILMRSSATLQTHVTNFEDENAVYGFRLYDGGTAWVNSPEGDDGVTIQSVLDGYHWDIICLQQAQPQKAETYQPYCDELINLITVHINYPVKFIWYLTQIFSATQNSGAPRSEETIQSYYESAVLAAQTVKEQTVCDFVVPVGTAIQNARSIEAIKTIGAYSTNPNNSTGFGYLNAYDGVHLQEGLPCQIAAYTFILSLLDIYGMKEYSVNAETTRVTAEWTTGKNIPSPHGTPIGSTTENCLIAQKCAIMAMRHPYEVTDMNYIINPT